uniref:Uncharacterized protein n=1 Tax=Arundo donax TaxID=35708 RepID=A0A0A9C116_ARUDO
MASAEVVVLGKSEALAPSSPRSIDAPKSWGNVSPFPWLASVD